MDLIRTVFASFAVGALLYGATISLLHVVLNRLESPTQSLALLVFCCLLYGSASALAGLVGGLAARLWQKLRRQPAPEATATATTHQGLALGLALFQIPFWTLAWAYGRTYQQTPPFSFQGPLGMTLYLVVGCLLIASVFAFASWALARLYQRRPQQTRRAVYLLGGLLIGPHLVLPLATASRSTVASAVTPVVETEPHQGTPKVLLLGLDGADPEVLQKLVAAGELPNFARLMAEGVYGPLATLPDANSAVIWASIYTGTERQHHGVLDFYRILLPGVDPGIFPVHRTFFQEACDFLARTGLVDRTTVTASDTHAATLWQIVDHHRRSIGVVDGYFYSFPALEPQRDDSFFVSYGSDGFARQFEARTMGLEDLELFIQPRAVFNDVRTLLPQDDFDWQSSSLLRLLDRRGQPAFVNLYTHEPDSVQHQHWRSWQPEHYFGADETEQSASPILDMYRRFDRFLAQLDARLDPTTHLIIVSDHGHVPTLFHKLDTQHRHGPAGIFLARGPSFARGKRIDDAHVYDIAPTVLAVLGLPAAEDWSGRVLTSALEPGATALSPPPQVPSYDFLAAGPDDTTRRSRVLDAAEIEKLKKLGYL
jgi:hypothetical protein